jgi:hypothetical protein
MQDLRPGHNGHRPGSVDQRIRLIQMALPDNRTYIADLLDLGDEKRTVFRRSGQANGG